MKTKLPWNPVSLLMIFLMVGCAGQPDNTAKYAETTTTYAETAAVYYVFPFRNPSYRDRELSGIGMRFTSAFAAACVEKAFYAKTVMSDRFNSSKDINVRDAIVYASRTGADYIIYGNVTNWVDRPTKYTHPQDFAGLRIFVRSVESGQAVFTAKLQAHGITYAKHGTRNFTGQKRIDLIQSLATAMAEKLSDASESTAN
jgi:hypothetical protein